MELAGGLAGAGANDARTGGRAASGAQAASGTREWVFANIGALCVLGACAVETRVVSERGILTGIPGAVSALDNEQGAQPARAGATPQPDEWERLLRAFRGGGDAHAVPDASPDGSAETVEARLRRVLPGGKVVLISRTPADLLYHLSATLRNKEYDLLLEQVISERTKQEYRRRGRDAREAVDFLAANEKDVAALLWAFPMGDRTPGVRMEGIGRNAFRLRAPEVMRGELRFTAIDVVIEEGRFRLLMIE